MLMECLKERKNYNLTLTNVVFEFWIVIISLYLIYYLTLTNVVFEFTL